MASKKNIEEKANVVENLNSHLTKAGEKVANNKKIIFICIGVAACVAAFVLSYLFIYRNPRLQNSWEAYNKVLLMQHRDQNMEPAKLGDEFRNVATNFSSTPAGNIAALSAAEAYYDAEKYEDAVKLLTNLGISDPLLKSQAMALKGDCLVNLDKNDEALAAYDEAIQIADGNPELVPGYLIKKANIYSHLKQYDKSLACYEEIKAKYPRYQFGNGIDYYIEREKALAGK